ncbi:MAG: DUF4097 family beta strand repeat-containing protein [Candidatus Kryptonium sp.]
MRTKFLIFIITGLVFAGGLLLCSNIKTKEITAEYDSDTVDELKISKSFKANPNLNLYIESEVADVLIQSHEENKIDVDFYAKGLVKKLKEFNVSFEESENSLTIKVKRKKKIRWFDFTDLFDLFSREWYESVKLIVNVPQKLSNVSIKASGGDVKISSIEANFDISSAGGDIYGEGINGTIYASSAGGDIRLKSCANSGEIKTSGGDIFITDYQGSLELKSSGGDITVNKLSGNVNASSAGGDIKVDFFKPSGTTKLSSAGGDIKI